MDFRFLHAADLHLDSPLRGLSRYEGVPAEVVRTATRAALDNLVDFALREGVAFVILAGDLYDGSWEAFATGLYFCQAMGRLNRAGVDVFLIYGNHDAESHLTRDLPLPPNVKVFSKKAAETLVHPGTGMVLHGQSYRARDPGGDLAAGYPAAREGALNVGILHTALNGDRGHAPYAPCTPEQLAAKGYDYWALGHVHRFEIVRSDPYIVFPGNLQGRNIREVGPKGAALVTVNAGRIAAVDHVALDVVRWALAEVDVSQDPGRDAIHTRIRDRLQEIANEADGRPVMVRVRLSGTTSLHAGLTNARSDLREAVRAIATSLSDGLWIEKVSLATASPPVEDRGGDELRALLDGLSADADIERALAQDLVDFLTRVPAEADDDNPLLADARGGRLSVAVKDAAQAVRSRLGAGAAS